MIIRLFLWESLLFRDVADVAAFSGYSFGLLQKSASPAVREPQSLIKRKFYKLRKVDTNKTAQYKKIN